MFTLIHLQLQPYCAQFILQIDMVEIKEVYCKMYQRSLADDMHKYCTEEDLRNILLSLIKGTHNSSLYDCLILLKPCTYGEFLHDENKSRLFVCTAKYTRVFLVDKYPRIKSDHASF